MKLNCFYIVLLTVLVQNILSIPQISKRDLELAKTCDPSVCKPPSCRCASTTLDDKIPIAQIPQVIFVINFESNSLGKLHQRINDFSIVSWSC